MHKKSITVKKTAMFLLFAGITLMAGSCYYDKGETLYPGTYNVVDCSTVAAKFAANVQPIIQAKCATGGCHDASSAGGVSLLTYDQINAAKDRVKTRAVDQKTMPTSAPLLPAEINTLKCWLEAGAQNN